MMKLKFFTNISHEIRTPLTLIIGPIDKMLNGNISWQTAKDYLVIMQRNANQLLKLINQLLDFKKLEAGNLKLELRKDDLVGFIKGVVESFSELAGDKGIKLKINAVKNEIFMWFDPDKIEKIMNNLLSNALKFTGKEGQVSVNISLVLDNPDEIPGKALTEKKYVEIVVKDNGIGIQETDLEKIFLRFFQAPQTKDPSGTGIGLALTKELVKLHSGEIWVASKPGKGTKFTVRLPYACDTEKDAQMSATRDKTTYTPPEPLPDNKETPSCMILVVEDNCDMRFFIRSHFEPTYQVIEASDGKEGWQQVVNIIPDIIISDIMMPGMDGFEFCRKVKKDERTAHIPVILLTALLSREQQMDGIDAGADDYITKPFDIAILRAKVENLMTLRKSLREKYAGELVLKPRNIIITSPDERFLQKAIETVENNIADPAFSIEQFAAALCVSRMQLYRKMAALTDMTAKEFIRNIRLKRAAQLLSQDKRMNISEIAYAVGFNDLSHFRKCFRHEFGMNATEYAEKRR
jgi:DNA-binding response OmpR family regulator/two-component sensor histidine kinase